LATGAEAAGRALEEMGTRQLGSWAHQAQVISKVVPGLSDKIGVQAVKIGTKTVYEATNAAGRHRNRRLTGGVSDREPLRPIRPGDPAALLP